MIDPNLLTKEAGFVGGEWIEIDHHVMKWHGLELYDDEYIGWIVGEYENIDPSEVTSIRPLTGPMAIWNFLPKNIKAIVLDESGWPESQYYDTAPDLIIPRGAVFRPFWAQKKA